MKEKYQCIGILLLVALALIIVFSSTREDFANRREKARAIYDWFQRHPKPSYAEYRRDMNLASNIVEYEDALKLFQDRNLTVETAEKIV